jgi:hypothetical protein
MPVNKATGEVNDPPDFAIMLSQIRPATSREAADALADLVRAVQDTGKSGTLTLTIQVKPIADDKQIVQVFDEIKLRKPEHARKGSLAFPDSDGFLSRSDPNTLPLFQEDEDIKSPAGETVDDDIRKAPGS